MKSQIMCIADGINVTIEPGYVLFPEVGIPIFMSQRIRNEFISLLNKVKATKVVWEMVARVMNYGDVFLTNRIMPWRCGRTVGRTIYHNGELVGMMDTPALAAQVVGALNDKES